MTCTRRGFLKSSALLALPLLAPRFLFAQPGAAQSGRDVLVVIFQRGAMDGLNVLVPHGDADYYRLRPTIGIARPGSGAEAAIDLDGHFGLHPSLAALKPLWDAKQLAAVHATGIPTGNRSHFVSQAMVEHAAPQERHVDSGWLSRHLASVTGEGLFRGVGLGPALPMSLTGPAPALSIAAFGDFVLKTQSGDAQQLSRTLGQLYRGSQLLDDRARAAFSASHALLQADPARYRAENGAEYPQHPFGRQLQQVAQMVKAGIGLEVAALDAQGWDHHVNEGPRLKNLLGPFGQSLAAFVTDLGPHIEYVTVITMSEFGRRAYENKSAGTDHGTGNCAFVIGGGVNGGRVYADWPGLADNRLADSDLAITTDYRAVLAELLTKRRRETDVAAIFPGYRAGGALGLFKGRQGFQ